MKFPMDAMANVNFTNRWKIFCCVFVCINILICEYSGFCLGQLNSRTFPKPNYPGTQSNQRRNDISWMGRSKLSHYQTPSDNYTKSTDDNVTLPLDRNLRQKLMLVGNSIQASEVYNKQNYHHNEASPISPIVLLDAPGAASVSPNASDPRNTSNPQLDNEPFYLSPFGKKALSTTKLTTASSVFPILDFNEDYDNGDEDNGRRRQHLNGSSIKDVGDAIKEHYSPFADFITLRIGAFFEASELESMSVKFISSLKEQLQKLEEEFRSMATPNARSETDMDVGGEFQGLKATSVFGNAIIEGLVMEIPNLEEEKIIRVCETLHAKNVVAAVGIGTRKDIYATALISQTSVVPLVVGTSSGYADEEAFQKLFPFVVQTNPRLRDLWEAATTLIYTIDLYQPVLIHDTSYRGLSMSHIASQDPDHDTLQLSLNPDLTMVRFHTTLSYLLHTDRRVIFLCGTTRFVALTLEYGKSLGMFDGEFVWLLMDIDLSDVHPDVLIPGLLNIHPSLTSGHDASETFIRSSLSVILRSLKEGVLRSSSDLLQPSLTNCQVPSSNNSHNMSEEMNNFFRAIEKKVYSKSTSQNFKKIFHIENLVPNKTVNGTRWIRVGTLIEQILDVEALYWPGRGYRGVDSPTKKLRVAMVISPPFVMTSELIDNTTCLIGVICLKVFSQEIGAIFEDWEDGQRIESRFYKILCCNGLSVDLMINLANDLQLKLQVYLVRDGSFGARRMSGWTGVVGDIVDGSAHLSVAPLSVTSQRAQVIDFSGPYFYSSLAVLSSTRRMETPLLAFLVPFSAELWIAIFISLNVTALAVAIYEWLSPFGLNPWGRQRSKNFSYGSALWVIWGLLFSHLVAFKAPKSWPNKVLINVWGAFSVIFVASYTANIAALFAGLFNRRDGHQDKSYYSLRIGALRDSATEFYISQKDPQLWSHMKEHLVTNYDDALDSLHSGRLELLVGDSAILDHMRANDPGCTLQSGGPDFVDDSFAVAMPKGFPLKMRINAAISQYVASGHLEYLRHKWYGSSPCFRLTADIYKPQPLEIQTVGGVFLMLTLGIVIGIIILFLEHIVYRYALPSLRTKPKGSVWRNRNIMFFSQKLYKFINCVELVSPHHSAKELANNLRTGQIMGLFQKSVKRKENEQRRRRKSKAQFFEMIQEIRRVQKEEKSQEVVSSSMEMIDETSESERGPPHTPVLMSESSPLAPLVTSNNACITTSFTFTTMTTTNSSSQPLTVSSTFPHSPSTTISSTVSSSTRRLSSIHLSTGIGEKSEGKSPPGITIDYIPGPNPTEDFEGLLIVNKLTKKEGRPPPEADTTLPRKKSKEKRDKGSRKNSAKTDSVKSSKNSDDDYASLYSSPRRTGSVDPEENSAAKEIKRKKRRRKLERSSRIENSLEDQTMQAAADEDADDVDDVTNKPNEGSESSVVVLKVCDEPYVMNVTSLQLGFTATTSPPAKEPPCECHVPVRLDNTASYDFPPPLCINCAHPASKGGEIKWKSLDETKIEPPSDFMSPATSPLAKEFTSISFPCSPHAWESPSQRCVNHFHSDGESRSRGWGSAESHPTYHEGSYEQDLDQEFNRFFYRDQDRKTSQEYERISPSGYQSSGGSFHLAATDSPNNLTTDPAHLHNMTKGTLWRLWQDSEHNLRQRLIRLEEERNILASQLSKVHKKPSPELHSKSNLYKIGSIEQHQKQPTNQPLEFKLEVPPEFRDTNTKDFRKNRYSRSLEEDGPYRSAHKDTTKQSRHGDSHFQEDSLSRGARNREFEDFYRSVRSLEDSLMESSGINLESQRTSRNKLSKPKHWRRRKESGNLRRCRSSLDARRSRSLAPGSPSDSSESPRTEKTYASSVDRRDGPFHHYRIYQDPDSSSRMTDIQDYRFLRESGESCRRRRPAPLSLGDSPDKQLVTKDHKKRRSKYSHSDKVLPFSSLPRHRSQQRRKLTSSAGGYYSSTSSDADDTYYGRQYIESSPLPLLQSLQRHYLGKQRKKGGSTSIPQSAKATESLPTSFDARISPLQRNAYRNPPSSYFDNKVIYASPKVRGPYLCHDALGGNLESKTGLKPGRSSLEIRDHSTGDLF